MKIKIQLFGALGSKLPEFASPEGVWIELPDESTAGDLLAHLKIPEAWQPAIAMNSRLLKDEDPIMENAEIRLFQAVHGG